MTYLPKNLRHRFDPVYFLQKGGKKKRAEMIARNLANRSEMELLPAERTAPELLMSPQSFQSQAIPIEPNMQFIDNLQIKGSNPSIVDYMNSTGRNSSLSARRDLGNTFGINNIGKAEGNIRLLKILQEQDGYVAPVYAPPSANPRPDLWAIAQMRFDRRQRQKSDDPWAATHYDQRKRETGSGTVPEGKVVETRPAVIVPSSTGQVVAVNPSSSSAANNDSRNPYLKSTEDWLQWEDMYKGLKESGRIPWNPKHNRQVSDRFRKTFTRKDQEFFNSVQNTHPWLYQFINDPSVPENFKKSLKLEDSNNLQSRRARSSSEKRARIYLQYKDNPDPLVQQIITGKLTFPQLKYMYDRGKIDKDTYKKYSPLAVNSFGAWLSYFTE